MARSEPSKTAAAERDRVGGRAAAEPVESNEANRKAVVDMLAKAERRDALGASGVTAAAPAQPSAVPVAEEPGQPAPAATFQARPAGASLANRGIPDSPRPPSRGIISRDPAVRWRLAGAGVVERSLDAGASWERLETGAAASLTAGSAPTASVCWVVGGSGRVLLTTDARTWRRLPAPTPDDLVAVDATSDRDATVRTASGQSFRTMDGGVSWTRVP